MADFGLTEDTYGTTYFRRGKREDEDEEKVPIKWMAPESLKEDIDNEDTDVVSLTTLQTLTKQVCLHKLSH